MPWAARANRAPVANWQPLGSPRTNRADFSLEDDEVSEAQTRDFTQSIVGGGRRRDSGQTSRSAEVCKVDTAYSQATFTANFPAYPSGHATIGAACFDALRLYRKSHLRKAAPDQIDITIVSDELNGFSIDNFENRVRPREPAEFDSIEQMIQENADSRIFLGVHWRFDATSGVTSGKSIAEIVASRAYVR